MRRLATAAAAVLLLAALAPSTSASPPATRKVLPPQAVVQGQSLTDIGAAFSYWEWSTPLAINALTTGVCEPWPAHPRIWFLPQTLGGHPTLTCEVPKGVFLVFSPFNTECSNIEVPPFYGADAAGQRACANAMYDLATSLSVTVDGRAATGLDRYAVGTP